jgi:hypothetical protein
MEASERNFFNEKSFITLAASCTFGYFVSCTIRSEQGTLTEREGLSTVDLLINAACLFKKQIMFALSKADHLN